MRWMLLLDTCGAEGSVGIADLLPETPALVAERRLPGRETQERMMTALQETLAEAGIAVSDLEVVAVVTGPGSFTGVRIGLAAAKGLAEALSLPVIALSRLQVLAAQAQPENGQAETVVQAWIAAGRGDIFVGRYEGDLGLSETMLSGGDARAEIGGELVIVMEEKLATDVPDVLRVLPVGVCEALPLAVERARFSQFDEVALLNANYLRVPDAELARQRALSTT